jgi:hypothetical protein
MHRFWHVSAVLLCAVLFNEGGASGLQTPTSSGTAGVDAGSTVETLKAAVAGCATKAGWVLVTQPIEITGSVIVAATCTLRFQPGGGLTGSGSVAIPGEIVAGQTQQIFATSLAVTGLSAATSESGSVPVEWFGAQSTSFDKCASAPDATADLQAAINAMSLAGSVRLGPACYHTTHALTVTKSTIGIKGVSQGLSAPGVPGSSTLLSTSASADILDVTGTKDHYLIWNNLQDFAVERAVRPTGTAAGIAVNYAGGLRASGIWSLDSRRNIYLHGVPDYGVGVWRDVAVGWRNSNEPVPTGELYGWYFDSADGVGMNSFKGDHLACSNDLGSAPTTYCYYLSGATVKDVDLDSANVAGTSYGLYVNYTGKGEQDSTADIHLNMPTMDNCYVSCVTIKGLLPDGGASVSVNAGYLESNTAGTKVVDIESSYGVAITNNQIFAMGSTGGNIGVYASNSASLNIQQNKFQALPGGSAVELVHSTGSSITGNTLFGAQKQPMATGISLTNESAGNVIAGNAALGFVGTAFLFDGTSAANDLGANSCAPSNIKHCVSGEAKGTAPRK